MKLESRSWTPVKERGRKEEFSTGFEGDIGFGRQSEVETPGICKDEGGATAETGI